MSSFALVCVVRVAQIKNFRLNPFLSTIVIYELKSMVWKYFLEVLEKASILWSIKIPKNQLSSCAIIKILDQH